MSTRNFLKNSVFALLLGYALSGCQMAPVEASLVYQQISPYGFEDTLLNLDIAISEHNYRIIHRSDIGQAIRDRGESDFPQVILINFCNITYAREMLLLDDNLINEMSCEIAVRESDNQVIVSSRLMNEQHDNPQVREFAQRINQNIRLIIEASLI